MLNLDKYLQDIVVNEFTEKSALEFRKRVTDITKIDPQHPIIIYIDSYGGYVDSLAMMIETIDSVSNPIITVCIGKAMSCGAILLAAGDYRFCGRHSRILIHEVSGGARGDVHDLAKSAEELKRLNKYWMTFIAKQCGLKGYDELRKIIKDNDGRDLVLTPNKAKEFGLVDEIGLPQVQPLASYQIDPLPEKKRGAHIVGKDGNNQLAEFLQALEMETAKKKAKKKVTKKATKKKVKKKVTKKKSAKAANTGGNNGNS